MNMLIKRGSTGQSVRKLTEILSDRGHLQTPVTSTFDGHVLTAVREFQARHLDERGRPLVVDGVVGPMTWWALLSDAPSKAPERRLSLPSCRGTGGSTIGRLALLEAIQEANAGAMEIDGNNNGPYVAKYLNRIVPPPANWCAGFVSWCFTQANDGECPFSYSLGARDIRNQFKRRGWAFDASEESPPAPGDIVVWWRGQPQGWMGHIGLVHHLSESGVLYTIEGNKGAYPAPVAQFDYVLSRMKRVLGFGRVPDQRTT